MSNALDELAADGDCAVVVVTGAGDKAFSAGMDLKAFASGEGAAIMGGTGGFGGITQRHFPKPIIAAVNGAALAGGCEIMLSCDLVVAADHATFGIPEAKRGLVAGAGGLIRLPKRLPIAIALELALTGDAIDASRALQLGLVNRVVPGGAAQGGDPGAGRRHRRQRAPVGAVVEARHGARRGRLGGRGLEAQRRGGGGGVLVGRRHGGPHRLRREAQAQLAGQVAPAALDAHDLVQGGLASALDGIRVSLHVLAATVWVGGQITMAGLVPAARSLGEGAPRVLARAFGRIQWPAYAVLVVTGFWNVSAVRAGQPHAWQVVLGVKIVVVALAGVSAYLHTRASTTRGLAVWGAVASLSSLAALVMGVFLAG